VGLRRAASSVRKVRLSLVASKPGLGCYRLRSVSGCFSDLRVPFEIIKFG